MPIYYNDCHKVFHLKSGNMSYIMGINKYNILQHLYWGEQIELSLEKGITGTEGRFFNSDMRKPDNIVSYEECIRSEYGYYGTGDYKAPAFEAEDSMGYRANKLEYVSHIIYDGKPMLKGLPATYMESDGEGQTLEITLTDKAIGLNVILVYSVFERLNAVIRSVKFINSSGKRIKLLKAMSMCVDMEDCDYDYIQLWGSWGNERNIERMPVSHGRHCLDSRRGSSSHQKNPFTALLRKNTDENHGEAYGFSLVYSGSFTAQIETEQYDLTRVTMGINPHNFSWELDENEEFQTPEAVMVYSNAGIGGMSRTYHRLYRERLCRGKYRDTERPVLINNWEATYFDFNSEKILKLSETAKELGIELFVLDDGWFGKRNSCNCSLGDWKVNLEKLPEGLNKLSEKINALGMKFGLWFEPEMISPDSDLYRNHPDWCLHIPGRERTQVRSQLVLDLSRQEICDYVYNSISDVLKSADISYVKWDFNRELTEVGNEVSDKDRQGEIRHRYVLGLYSILERLNKDFPDVLFEGCASGGGRFDPGMLYYSPQIWTSDNTDAVSRLKIQYGTSMAYPISSMGAHVSAVPNHQTGRVTPLSLRGNVAFTGAFGYELDLNMISDEEKSIIKEQVKRYKELRGNIQKADMYRLLSPYENDRCAWMYVSEDKRWAFVFFARISGKAAYIYRDSLKLSGLDKNLRYSIEGQEGIYTGGELMKMGLDVSDANTDYSSRTWVIEAV